MHNGGPKVSALLASNRRLTITSKLESMSTFGPDKKFGLLTRGTLFAGATNHGSSPALMTLSTASSRYMQGHSS